MAARWSLFASFCTFSSSHPPRHNGNNHSRSDKVPNKSVPKGLRNKHQTSKLRTRTTSTTTTSSNDSVPPLSSSVLSTGGDATTYKRLPPKDDFLSAHSNTSLSYCTEIKLADSTIADPSYRKPSKKKIDAGSLENDKLGVDYGKFEVFEVGSDSDSEIDDDGVESGDAYDGVESGEEDKEKEKGLPAVMRCFDRAKVYVKAGDGGNGVVAFRREKYVPMGGPSGGDGGRGGNVYVEVDESMNSLLPFRQCVHFSAGRGRHGQGRKQHGAKGEDVVVKVPPGTVISEASMDGGNGEVLLELVHSGQRAILLPGGRGGRGNASFKSGINKVPKIAENGVEGSEM